MLRPTIAPVAVIALALQSQASAQSGGYLGNLMWGAGPGTQQIEFSAGPGVNINASTWSYTNIAYNGGWLTLGLNVYAIGSSAAPTATQDQFGVTYQVESGYAPGSTTLPTWGIAWTMAFNGAQPTAADSVWWAASLAPATAVGSSGSWGTWYRGLADASGSFSGSHALPTGLVWQNTCTLADPFVAVQTELWPGMQFDPSGTGMYLVGLNPMSGGASNSAPITQFSVSVNVVTPVGVPAPGAVVLLAASAGVSRRRRR